MKSSSAQRRRTASRGSVSKWPEIANLLERVDAARERLQRKRIRLPDEIWYRGQRSAQYTLLPTLLRLRLELSLPDDELRALENDMFFEFQAKGASLMGTGLSGWDHLFIMRHHGLPTRLLDWSESFAIALFFAMDRTPEEPTEKDSDAALFLLNPYRLNAMTMDGDGDDIDLYSPKAVGWHPYDIKPKHRDSGPEGEYYDYGELLLDEEGIDWESPLALYPIRNSPRVHAQHGWFTLHGNDHRPLETIAPNAVEKIVIEKKSWPAVRDYLASTGLDAFRIYGDLDSLATSILSHTRALYGQRTKRPKRKKRASARSGQSAV